MFNQNCEIKIDYFIKTAIFLDGWYKTLRFMLSDINVNITPFCYAQTHLSLVESNFCKPTKNWKVGKLWLYYL